MTRNDGGYVVPGRFRDELVYADATVIGQPFSIRVLAKVDDTGARVCLGCEGTGRVAWVVSSEWPTPHELPVTQAPWGGLKKIRQNVVDARIGRARPCKYCGSTGLRDGAVQQEIAQLLERLMDSEIRKAFLQNEG